MSKFFIIVGFKDLKMFILKTISFSNNAYLSSKPRKGCLFLRSVMLVFPSRHTQQTPLIHRGVSPSLVSVVSRNCKSSTEKSVLNWTLFFIIRIRLQGNQCPYNLCCQNDC